MAISYDCMATSDVNKFLLLTNSSTKFIITNLKTFIKVFDFIFKFAFILYLNNPFKFIFNSKSGMSEISVLNWSLTRYPTSVFEKNLGS